MSRVQGLAYFNEIDSYAAAWLRNLIAAGHIADGVVDERSIEDVHPRDLDGFTQCHFFAGIGVWSYALRRAGWADDRPVWTGSCPCQPFSAAGKGAGFADERHLWPAWHHLISECRPAVIFGEQVASKDAGPWIDLVHTDLEALAYAFGAIPFPSAGVGAPHIRDRLYFVADADGWRASAKRKQRGGKQRQQPQDGGPGGLASDSLGNAADQRLAQRLGQPGVSRCEGGAGAGKATERAGVHTCGLAHTDGPQPRVAGRPGGTETTGFQCGVVIDGRGTSSPLGYSESGPERMGGAGQDDSFWRNADWLRGRDGKWRPVEPGTFPLAHGASARVGRLRAYGNAICAEAAAAFISSAIDVRGSA